MNNPAISKRSFSSRQYTILDGFYAPITIAHAKDLEMSIFWRSFAHRYWYSRSFPQSRKTNGYDPLLSFIIEFDFLKTNIANRLAIEEFQEVLFRCLYCYSDVHSGLQHIYSLETL